MVAKEEKITIFDVADWFLSKEAMTHKKLQKLCYYAVAWNWGINQDQLCENDDFEAWIHGPVNVSLYEKYKKYKWHPIDLYREVPKITQYKEKLIILKLVWNTYHHMDGYDLEVETHYEDPFRKARGELADWEPSSEVIKKEDMVEYYGKRFEEE